jgi:acetyl esterase/lipase
MPEPEIVAFVRATESFFPADTAQRPITEQRALYDTYCRAFAPARPAGVTSADAALDVAGHSLALRCYRGPAGRQRGTLVYLHGGGFVLGGLDSHDAITARLAVELDASVVAVDYRLAPEHPFPAACDDADAVVAAALDRALPFDLPAGPVLLAGDSAGGTLAASAALTRRDRGGTQPAGMVLIYPMLGPEADTSTIDAASRLPSADGSGSETDERLGREHGSSPSPHRGEGRGEGVTAYRDVVPPHPALPRTPSPHGRRSSTSCRATDQTDHVLASVSHAPASTASVTDPSPLLSRADVIWYRDTWLSGAPPTARAFPLLGPDLAGLPPMLLLAAEHDVLRDHASAFAARVTADGGEATAVVCEGLVHGSLRAIGRSPAADRMLARAVDFLRQRLADTN